MEIDAPKSWVLWIAMMNESGYSHEEINELTGWTFTAIDKALETASKRTKSNVELELEQCQHHTKQ